ncbi:MAG TPA: DUF5752 family protein [Candidatus Dormibacteraeota bacterium]|jgi:hypothetical protein|nr:DUF5752 family protein [Candidatus Dormibacteraeota bacterium]
MNTSEMPFEFFTVAHLTRIGNQSAATLAEFLTGLEQCSDASIFHHTFQTLGSHHFLTEGFSNDFAQWALADANRDALAEQLTALDIRDYISIAALRADLCRVVREYCGAHPEFAHQTTLEPFYFCESVEVTVPFGRTATTLDEFRQGIEHLSHAAFYFHFISSRLRLQLRTNDFSHWLADGLGLKALADSVNRIDIYTNTLDSARGKLIQLIDLERRKHVGSTNGEPHSAR